MPGNPSLLRLVIRHIPDVNVGLIRLSDERYIIFDGSNVGVPNERMEGQCVWDVIPQERHEFVSSLLSTVRRGGTFREDYPYNGTIHVMQAQAVEHDGEEYALVVTRDVTLERQEAELLGKRGGIDTLTGLPRRGVLQVYADEQIRKDFPFTVLFIDLDHFKKLNDSRGHEAGDKLLQRVSRAIQRCIRPEDLVVRLGGDEFVVILRQVKSSQTTWAVAERIRKSVRETSNGSGVECSIGVSFYPADGSTLDELLHKADSRMYLEKQEHHAGNIDFSRVAV